MTPTAFDRAFNFAFDLVLVFDIAFLRSTVCVRQ